MKYPKFLKYNDTIGITALSSGCSDSVFDMNLAINNLKKEKFNIVNTDNVYGNYVVSSDKNTRISELNDLLRKDIQLLQIARGGEFLYELLDSIPYEEIVEKNILVQGYSDPTSLLYVLTTKYDFATIYGLNGKSYSDMPSKYIANNLEILKGNFVTQTSFDNENVSLNGEFESDGIIIGGCLEVLKNLIGTKYDNTLNFIEKYKDKKIIWYFDIYAMKPIDVYLTLLQLKDASWFKYTDTFLIGKVLIKQDETDFSYLDAYKALSGNIVYDVNIGHVKPVFTIINGAYVSINFKNENLTLKQQII